MSLLWPLLFLISDINNEISDATVSCFVDDTRILLGIKDDEDAQKQPSEFHTLYIWTGTNNMKFNADKFELLRYGKE